MISLIGVTIISATIHFVSTTNETQLQVDKLLGYNTNIIPTISIDNHILINILMFPHSIVRFNEQDELLNINMFVHMNWIDYRLSWQPIEYGNRTRTIYKQKQIWLPDLVLTYSKVDMKQIGFADLNVAVDFKGKVIWEPGVVADITCAVDPTYFPFDQQTCTIVLSTWTHDPKSVKFVVRANGDLNMSHYRTNGLWEVVDSSTEIEEYELFTIVNFIITLKRRWNYYVTSLICPVMAISVLNCMTFLIPKDCGERLSYSMTSLLSFMVLLSITTESLPKTSKHTPYFVFYLTCMLILALFTVMYSVVSLILTKKRSDDEEDITSENEIDQALEAKHLTNGKLKEADLIGPEEKRQTVITPLTSHRLAAHNKVTHSGEYCMRRKIMRLKESKMCYFYNGLGCDTVMFMVVTSITCCVTIVTFMILCK